MPSWCASSTLALGTNKLAATWGTAVSSATYVRKGLFKPLLWKAAALGTLIGACSGTLATFLFSSEALGALLPLLVAGAALYVLLKRGGPKRGVSPTNHRPTAASSRTLGVGLGIYDGFFGPGTGTFWTTLVMALYPVGIVEASGVARSMNFVSNAVSLLTFVLMGSVHYGVGLPLGVTLMAGAWLGAHSAIRFGAQFIRPTVVAVALMMALYLVWQHWM